MHECTIKHAQACARARAPRRRNAAVAQQLQQLLNEARVKGVGSPAAGPPQRCLVGCQLCRCSGRLPGMQQQHA